MAVHRALSPVKDATHVGALGESGTRLLDHGSRGLEQRQGRATPEQKSDFSPLRHFGEQVAQRGRLRFPGKPEIGRGEPAGDVHERLRARDGLGDRGQRVVAVDMYAYRVALPDGMRKSGTGTGMRWMRTLASVSAIVPIALAAPAPNPAWTTYDDDGRAPARPSPRRVARRRLRATPRHRARAAGVPRWVPGCLSDLHRPSHLLALPGTGQTGRIWQLGKEGVGCGGRPGRSVAVSARVGGCGGAAETARARDRIGVIARIDPVRLDAGSVFDGSRRQEIASHGA